MGRSLRVGGDIYASRSTHIIHCFASDCVVLFSPCCVASSSESALRPQAITGAPRLSGVFGTFIRFASSPLRDIFSVLSRVMIKPHFNRTTSCIRFSARAESALRARNTIGSQRPRLRPPPLQRLDNTLFRSWPYIENGRYIDIHDVAHIPPVFGHSRSRPQMHRGAICWGRARRSRECKFNFVVRRGMFS